MKKAKIKVRRAWRINPRTKIKESAKVYSRRKVKIEAKKIAGEELK